MIVIADPDDRRTAEPEREQCIELRGGVRPDGAEPELKPGVAAVGDVRPAHVARSGTTRSTSSGRGP